VEGQSSRGQFSYEPTIFVGTYSLSQEQRRELFFVGHVLGRLQGQPPAAGRIVGRDGKAHQVKLENSDKELRPLLEPLQEWAEAPSPEPPPLILNRHCPECPFQSSCRAQAEQEDNLSLLDSVTPRVIKRYERKGIFAVKQLSYLFKPKRRRKRRAKPRKCQR
jgi:predicted RecB family nuclease